MTPDDAKRAIMGWQGVVGAGERGGAIVVYVERDTIAIPDEFSGYRLVKKVSGKIVAGLPTDDAAVRLAPCPVDPTHPGHPGPCPDPARVAEVRHVLEEVRDGE